MEYMRLVCVRGSTGECGGLTCEPVGSAHLTVIVGVCGGVSRRICQLIPAIHKNAPQLSDKDPSGSEELGLSWAAKAERIQINWAAAHQAHGELEIDDAERNLSNLSMPDAPVDV